MPSVFEQPLSVQNPLIPRHVLELLTLQLGSCVEVAPEKKYSNGESIEDIAVCKRIIQKTFQNCKLPYISITPTFSICSSHGYVRGEHFVCPECGVETEVWSRVTGYLRPVANFNDGKKQEYRDRVKYRLPEEVTAVPVAEMAL